MRSRIVFAVKVFADIKSFDENLKMYGDDLDFCLRTRKKGWKMYFIPDCHLIHYGKGIPTRDELEMLDIYHDSMEYY